MTVTEPEETPAGPHKMWVGIGEAIHAKVQSKVTAARTEATASMLEQIEADLVPLVKPIAQAMLDDPAVPDELRPALEVLAGPEHFSGSIVISFAVGAILSPVLSAAVAPLVQGLSNSAWSAAVAKNPLGAVPLSPPILASAVLKGVIADEATAAPIAANSGVDAGAFHVMVEAAGQSLGLEQALLLYRRKQIPWSSTDPTAPGLLQVIQYSNINPRFYSLPEMLQYVPLSVGEVVTANLKGHLSDGDAVTMLQEAGIDGAAVLPNGLNMQQLLRAASGRPPGIEQMLELRNRTNAGLTTTQITDADVAAAVRQSDINDTFLPAVMELGYYLPPPRSIVPMLRSKAITPQQAQTLLTAYGVKEPWASAFVAEAQSTATGKTKELGQSQIVSLYEQRLMDGPTALGRLETLTYDAADAQALLDLADEKRKTALQNAALRKVGTEYVNYKITLAEATTALNAAGIPTAAQHDAVTYWDVEKSVNIRKPTPAQIMGAFRRGDIDGTETHDRLIAAGVLQSDMHIVAADGFPPTKPNPKAAAIVVAGSALYVDGTNLPPAGGVRQETVAQITQLYVARTIDKPTAVARLVALGYTAASANDLITLAGPQVPLPTTGA